MYNDNKLTKHIKLSIQSCSGKLHFTCILIYEFLQKWDNQ